MATLAPRYKGGPLADYRPSFTGLKGFYDLQKPGATQHEQLQNDAVNQQEAAGGFYRPGSRPEPVPTIPQLPKLGPPSFTPRAEGAFSVDQPTLDIMNQEREKGTITGDQYKGAMGLLDKGDDPADVRARLRQAYWHNYGTHPDAPQFEPAPPAEGDKVGQVAKAPVLQNGVFARPAGMAGPPAGAPALAPNGPVFTPGAVPAGGRSMKDPNRIAETIARAHRGDPRTQFAAAEFFRGNQDRAARDEEARARGVWEAEKFDRQQQGAAAGRVETNRHNQELEAHSQAVEQRQIAKAAIDADVSLSREQRERAKAALDMFDRTSEPQFVPVPNSGGGVIMKGNHQGSGFIKPDAPEGPMIETAPGSGVFYNPKLKTERFQMTDPGSPAIPPVQAPGPYKAGLGAGPVMFPGQQPRGPQFTPIPKENVKGAQDHFALAEKLRRALAESDATDSKHPMDGATKARYQRLLQYHLTEYEKAHGMGPEGVGELKKADEERMQAAPVGGHAVMGNEGFEMQPAQKPAAGVTTEKSPVSARAKALLDSLK